MNRLRHDIVTALMLLTRLPVHRLAGPGTPAAAVWAYPLVGALVGGIGAIADWAGRHAGLPPLLAAVGTLAAMIAVTGALHEDGLADTADGLGARGDAARTLAILRDSRIGTYGALALMLSLAARAAGIAALANPAGTLIAAGITGRATMLVLLLGLAPARSDGLGASLRTAGRVDLGIGLAFAAVADWLLLPPPYLMFAAILAATAGLGQVAKRRIGGYTGDILGAAEQVGEVLTVCFAVGG